MKNFRAVPIRSKREARRAEAAGALIQFTACGDEYDAPLGVGGWIESTIVSEWFDGTREVIGKDLPIDGPDRLRAIYPITAQSRPSLWRRLFGRREAA